MVERSALAVSLINKWMFGGENIKPEELKKYEIWGEGKVIFFPNIDETLPVRIFANGLFSSC